METSAHSGVRPPRNSRQRGFTLIELMIAVAVVGLLAMVALPSMMDSIRKSRRAEAFAAITAIQQAQERRRGNEAAYTSSLSAIGIANATTSSGRYVLSTTGSGSGYVVTAIGTEGTSQATDQCRKLSVQMEAGVIKYASCSACTSFTYETTDPCWSR